MLTSAAGVIVSEALPEIDPDVAVMVTRPGATLAASPALAGEFEMVAIAASDELQ